MDSLTIRTSTKSPRPKVLNFVTSRVASGDYLGTKRHLLELAMLIEPNIDRLLDWWDTTPIDEFDGSTAAELVRQEMADPLELFLLAIILGERS